MQKLFKQGNFLGFGNKKSKDFTQVEIETPKIPKNISHSRKMSDDMDHLRVPQSNNSTRPPSSIYPDGSPEAENESTSAEKLTATKMKIDELTEDEQSLLDGGLVDMKVINETIEKDPSLRQFKPQKTQENKDVTIRTTNDSGIETMLRLSNTTSKSGKSKVSFGDKIIVKSTTTINDKQTKQTKKPSSFVTTATTTQSDFFGPEEEVVSFQWQKSPEFFVPCKISSKWSNFKLIKKVKDGPEYVEYIGELNHREIERRNQMNHGDRVTIRILKRLKNPDRKFLSELALLAVFNGKRRRNNRIVPRLLGFITSNNSSIVEVSNFSEYIRGGYLGFAQNIECLSLRAHIKGDLRRQNMNSPFFDMFLISRLASVLHELHQEGFNHHNLSPDSIYLAIEGHLDYRPILSGFEYVQVKGTSYKFDWSRWKMYLDGTCTNSLCYVSPELAESLEKAYIKHSSSSFKRLMYHLFVDDFSEVYHETQDLYSDIGKWMDKSDCFSFGMIAQFIFNSSDPFSMDYAKEMTTHKNYESRILLDKYHEKMDGISWVTAKQRMQGLKEADAYLDILQACIDQDFEIRPDFEYLRKATNVRLGRKEAESAKQTLAMKLQRFERKLASKG